VTQAADKTRRSLDVSQTSENAEPRATMTAVAHAAGVSQTTVSLVLNDVKGTRFSVGTRKRVLEAAERLNYRPTRRRTASRAGAQGAIAFVVDEMSTDPWMALALDGIRSKAWERGLAVGVFVTGGVVDVERAALAMLSADRYAGLIFGAINLRRIEPFPTPADMPTVLLNCYLDDHTLPSIVPAEVLGGHAAAKHLIDAGHRRIGYINGEPSMDASRDRLKGYRRALAEADILFDRELVRGGNWEPSAGYEQTLALMKLKRPPTAIFCANDMMAFGCYEALRELGLKIPRDVAVIGYDDRDIATFLKPPLTTFLLPIYAMGVEAAECLFGNISRPLNRLTHIKVEGELIERGSV
jgi:LacI family transcriptional regulator